MISLYEVNLACDKDNGMEPVGSSRNMTNDFLGDMIGLKVSGKLLKFKYFTNF